MKKYRQSLALLALVLASASLSFAQNTREVKKTVALNAGGAVSIDTHKGSVTVNTWDRDEVEITARVEAGGQSADERRWVEETEVHIQSAAGAVRIKSDYDKIEQRMMGVNQDGETSWSLPLIHYTITMPRAARLIIDDHKSQISVSDLSADLLIDTHKGSVKVARHGGAIKLETHKGDARVEFAGFARQSSFDTHKGEIEIILPAQLGFDLDSEMGKGAHLDSAYDLGGLTRSDDRHEARRRGQINGGGALLRLSSHKGQIRLRQS